MSLLSFLAPISGIIGAVAKGADSLHTSREEEGRIEIEKAKIALESQKLAGAAAADQRAINKVMAGHKSLYISGWQAHIGWTCGFGFTYHVLIYPLFADAIFQSLGFRLQKLDWQELAVVMTTLLGAVGARTYQKKKGVATERLRP